MANLSKLHVDVEVGYSVHPRDTVNDLRAELVRERRKADQLLAVVYVAGMTTGALLGLIGGFVLAFGANLVLSAFVAWHFRNRHNSQPETAEIHGKTPPHRHNSRNQGG